MAVTAFTGVRPDGIVRPGPRLELADAMRSEMDQHNMTVREVADQARIPEPRIRQFLNKEGPPMHPREYRRIKHALPRVGYLVTEQELAVYEAQYATEDTISAAVSNNLTTEVSDMANGRPTPITRAEPEPEPEQGRSRVYSMESEHPRPTSAELVKYGVRIGNKLRPFSDDQVAVIASLLDEAGKIGLTIEETVELLLAARAE